MVAELLDPDRRTAFVEDNLALQEELKEVYGRKRRKTLLAYDEARANRLRLDWRPEDLPRPDRLGLRVLADFPLEELVSYIDWTFFFVAWELKGRFPRILDDPKLGPAARELYSNARRLLDEIVERGSIQARATWGLWPASSVGDDVVLYADEARRTELVRFPMLRQQEAKLDPKKPHRSLADYVAPRSTGLADHVGAFAVNAGIGVDDLVARYQAEHDDYRAILVKALADRLAEAFAELLHRRARRAWGYGAGEDLSPEDLIAEKYRGIRPAFGYPACPDHTPKGRLWQLLDAERSGGMTLTEHYAIHPTAAVTGLYFAHPKASYFAVGRVGRDQVRSYAERSGMTVAEAERWLAPNLGYEPEPREKPVEVG